MNWPHEYVKKIILFVPEGLRNQYCQYQEAEKVSVYMVTLIKSNIDGGPTVCGTLC